MAAAYGLKDLDLGHGFHETKRRCVTLSASRPDARFLTICSHSTTNATPKSKPAYTTKKAKRSTAKGKRPSRPLTRTAPDMFPGDEMTQQEPNHC